MLWDRWLTVGPTKTRWKPQYAKERKYPLKEGRRAFRKNFPFASQWKGRYYDFKQVMPVVADEPQCYVVITVYVFYFGGNP